MRTTSSFLRLLAPLALGLLLVAGCKVKDATFTEGTGSADDAAVDDAPPDVPTGPPGFLVDMSATTVVEGQTRTFTVALTNAPTEAMLVNLSVANDTKLGISPTALLFSGANWNVPQTVTLTGKSDADTIDEVVGLSMVSAAIATPYNVDITVDDDDGLALALSTSMLDVGEGQTGSVNVSLTAQPAADVTVTVMSGNLNAAQVSLSSLTFTSLNWMTPQSLTVTGMQDLDTANATTMVTFTSVDLTTSTLAIQVTDDDVLGISPSVSAVPVTEGASATFSVALTQQPSTPVTVTVTSGNTAAATVSPASLTFTTTDWNVAQEITVIAPQDDDVATGTATVTLAATGLTPRTVAVTVTDDDTQAILTTPASTVAITEGATATLNVRLAFRPASDVVVSVSSLAPGIATVTPATLSFSSTSFATNQPVTISAQQDADAVAGTTSVRLESAGLGLQRDVTVDITDDDTLAIEADTTTLALTEGMTPTFGVRLTAQPIGPLTIAVASSDTSAATATSSVSFTTTNWSTYQPVTVTGVEDNDLAAENVTLTVSGVGPARTVAVTVTDNDTQAIVANPTTVAVTEGSTSSLAISLAFKPAADTMVTIVSVNTAVASVSVSTRTFTTVNYATPQFVVVTGVQDADTLAGTTTINLTSGALATAVPVNVTDDDALNIDLAPLTLAITEGGSGVLRVRLTAQPAAQTMVTLATSDPTAASLSTTTLTFTTADYATYQNVTVSGVEDADAAPETATVTATSGVLTPRVATVNVTDNDPLNIVASAATVPVTEGGTATFGVKLSAQPGATVTVNIASNDNGAVTVSPTQLTFTTADWATNKPVTLTGVQDVDLRAESVAIDLTGTGLGGTSVTATVAEDDVQKIVTSKAAITVGETATTTVNVTLAFEPTAATTVTIGPANSAVASVTPTTLVFDAANYTTVQGFTIAGTDDADAVDGTTTVSLSAPSATGASVAVTVTDNDTLGIETSVTSTTVLEGGTSAFDIRLTAAPTAPLTVTVTSGDPAAATVSPSTLTFTAGTWDTFQKVTITGVQDADAVADNVTISATSPGLTARTVAVTVTDDEVQAIVIDSASLVFAETSARKIGVRLAAQPTTPVTVNVTSTLGATATLSTTSLEFDEVNYDALQYVNVTGVVDASFDYETGQVKFSSTGLPTQVTQVTIIEPEIIEMTEFSKLTICPFGFSSASVRLKGNPRGALTLDVRTTSTIATVSPAQLTFTALSFSTYQGIDVSAGSLTGTVPVTVSGSGLTTRTGSVEIKNSTFCILSR